MMIHKAKLRGKDVSIEMRSPTTIAHQFEGEHWWTLLDVVSVETPKPLFDGRAMVSISGERFLFESQESADRLLAEITYPKESNSSQGGTFGGHQPTAKDAIRFVESSSARSTNTLRNNPALRRAVFAATVVERVGWVVASFGTLGGIVISFSHSIDAQGNETSNAVSGLTTGFGSILLGLGSVMVAAYIKGQSEQR